MRALLTILALMASQFTAGQSIHAALSPAWVEVLDSHHVTHALYTEVMAAAGQLFVIEQHAGEVHQFPLPTLHRAEQFSKMLRYGEADHGLLIGQPWSIAVDATSHTVFILDSSASLWAINPLSQARALVPLWISQAQGDLTAVGIDPGDHSLFLLDASNRRLWHYAAPTHGQTAYYPTPFGAPLPTDVPLTSVHALIIPTPGSILFTAAGSLWSATRQQVRRVVLTGVPRTFHPEAIAITTAQNPTLLLLDIQHARLAMGDPQGHMRTIIALPAQWKGALAPTLGIDSSNRVIYIVTGHGAAVWAAHMP